MLKSVLRPVLKPALSRASSAAGERFGPELVVNGQFATSAAWAAGAQWAVGGGIADKVGAGTSLLEQAIAISPGFAYRVIYSIARASVDGDGMSCLLGTTAGAISAASGVYIEVLVPVLGGNLQFAARGAGAWQGGLNFVSVRQVLS
jgi:hypothetical protein